VSIAQADAGALNLTPDSTTDGHRFTQILLEREEYARIDWAFCLLPEFVHPCPSVFICGLISLEFSYATIPP
jgi:hypothetical protein